VKRAGWTEPCSIPLDLPDDDAPADSADEFPRENLLSPPFDPGKGVFRWAPQSLGVYQVYRIG
jgi:hypothetical protein